MSELPGSEGSPDQRPGEATKRKRLVALLLKLLGGGGLGVIIAAMINISPQCHRTPPPPSTPSPTPTPTRSPTATSTVSPTPTPRSKLEVVLLDTAKPEHNYDKNWPSNAHFLNDWIRHEPVLARFVNTHPVAVGVNFQGDDQVTDFHPDLIIIHRSTFGSEQKLIRSLSKFRETRSFLIFSRTEGTDKRWAASIAAAVGINSDRVHAYQFPDGNPFGVEKEKTRFSVYLEDLFKNLQAR